MTASALRVLRVGCVALALLSTAGCWTCQPPRAELDSTAEMRGDQP